MNTEAIVQEAHWTTSLSIESPISKKLFERHAKDYATIADWWANSESGEDMLTVLEALSYANATTLRLLACQFIRETYTENNTPLWGILSKEDQNAIEVAERYANGEATEEELYKADPLSKEAAWNPIYGIGGEALWESAMTAARRAAWCSILVPRAYSRRKNGHLRLENRNDKLHANIIRRFISASDVSFLLNQQ